MKKILITVLSFVLASSFFAKAEHNIMFEKANQLYHNKNYDSAVHLYQQMINDGYCSADLFYNAGNAYYRINKIGMAIWCYEKAIAIHPSKNYTDNLMLAMKRIKDPIESIPDIFFIRWWKALYHLFTVNVWAIWALISFLLSFSILFLQKIKSNIVISKSWNVVLFLISGFCLLMLLVRSYNETYHYKGIVIEPQTVFMTSSKKEPIFLSEGIQVQVVGTIATQRGGSEYIQVKLPDGREGKIDRKSIIKL